MIEHGGNIDKAINIYGGKKNEWIDLSTGISPDSYPVPLILPSDWRELPTIGEVQKLELIIQSQLNTSSQVAVSPGSQIAIHLLPSLMKKKNVTILNPTYEDYSFSFKNAGYRVRFCENFEKLSESEIVVIVNPNNPDGKVYDVKKLLTLSKNVKILIVDESFNEASKAKSITSYITKETDNIIVIKSFGKFYGLAGLRLGFIFSGEKIIYKFKNLLGNWPISKVSIKIASQALQDKKWKIKNQKNLIKTVKSLDEIMKNINLDFAGGTNLFRLYFTENASILQKLLAQKYIWSRIFSYSKNWLRLGIPNSCDLKIIKKKLKNFQI